MVWFLLFVLLPYGAVHFVAVQAKRLSVERCQQLVATLSRHDDIDKCGTTNWRCHQPTQKNIRHSVWWINLCGVFYFFFVLSTDSLWQNRIARLYRHVIYANSERMVGTINVCKIAAVADHLSQLKIDFFFVCIRSLLNERTKQNEKDAGNTINLNPNIALR